MSGRLEEYLIQMQDNRIADELTDRLSHLFCEGHGAEKFAMRIHWAQLQVGRCLRARLSVAIYAHVAQQTFLLEAFQFHAHGCDFPLRPELRHAQPTFFPKLLHLLSRKFHCRSLSG